MKDKKFTSIILEFLQNARDLEEPTTDLQIEIGDDQAILSHENPRWTYAQLSAAVQINLSSKQGDIGTIGEFGLGLKYWWKWYKEFALDITCDCQGTPWTHRLSFEGAFNGEKSVVSSRPNPGHQSAPVSRSANGKTRPNSLICPTACRILTAESGDHLNVQRRRFPTLCENGETEHNLSLTWEGEERNLSSYPIESDRFRSPHHWVLLKNITYRKFTTQIDGHPSCWNSFFHTVPSETGPYTGLSSMLYSRIPLALKRVG